MSSKWDAVRMAAADPILGVAVAYNKDPLPLDRKVNLGIGAYRDANGKPLVLQCVREAEKKIAHDTALNKEYLPVEGLDRFLKVTSAVVFGKNSSVIKEGRVAVCQSLSGTGALRIAGEFIKMYHPNSLVYCSDPTWGNHHTIFKKAGLPTTTYRYLTKTMGLDIDGMLADLSAAPKGSTFVLHTVAHNPTGVDPTQEQWQRIADVCVARDAIVLFDTAYQGYASGDLEKDAYSVRYFVEKRGIAVLVTQSYSKNFGLYGERIGALNVVCRDSTQTAKVVSQLKGIVRPMYSNPQLHGARLVALVLEDDNLSALWNQELAEMSTRITDMRAALVGALTAIGCPPPNGMFKDWSHITSQIGMFAYTGLSAKNVQVLANKHHIYCTTNGRFSMAGVNPTNVGMIASAMKDAIASNSRL